MGICRDCFGKLSYTATHKREGYKCADVFSVTHGDNRIIKHEPYYITDATIDYGLDMPWDLQHFDSFIQAVRFLKENLDHLM